jgi:hypothetical protein
MDNDYEMDDMNDVINEDTHENFFFDNDPDNVNAIQREATVDTGALSVNVEFLQDLRTLKRSIYNAVVFGPPVGSEAAQDLRNLEVYESMLLTLNNLLQSIFDSENEIRSFESQQFSTFPEEIREPARAYCIKVLDFKTTNQKPYLNDVLIDLFDRLLKEHPY